MCPSFVRDAAKPLMRVAVVAALLLALRAETANAQPWTAVGSTGVVASGKLTYDCATQAIGFFRQSIGIFDCLNLPVLIGPSAAVAQPNASTGPGTGPLLLPLPTGSGRVVYNVVAEPNLFLGPPSLTVRFLVSDKTKQHILVRLIRQPRVAPTSSAVDVLLTLNTDLMPALTSIQTQTVDNGCEGGPSLDFDNFAYYITADISNANTKGGAVGVYQLRVEQASCIG